MVNVLILRITTLELIIYRTSTEHDRFGQSVFVKNDIAILIAGHWCIRTTDTLHFCFSIVRVLIDTLVTETVDATQSTVQLHAGQVGTILAVELVVEICQTGFIHRCYLVLVVGKCDVEVCRELARLDDAVTIQVELPADVLHVTGILPAQVRITCRCRNTIVAHQHIAGELPVELNVTRQAVVPETEVGTNVKGFLLLPFQILQLDVIWMHTALVHIGITRGISAEIQVFLTRLAAYDTPTRTQREHGYPGQGLLEPRFLMHVPAQ